MLQALDGYIIHGISTNISYLVKLIQGEPFRSNSISTKFCDEHTEALAAEIIAGRDQYPAHIPITGYLMYTLRRNLKTDPTCCDPPSLWQTVGYWRNMMSIRLQFGEEEKVVRIYNYSEKHLEFELDGQQWHASPISISPHRIEFTVGHENHVAWISQQPDNQAFVSTGGHIFRLKRHDLLAESVLASGYDTHGQDHNHVTSPMPGKVIKILTEPGKEVKKGETLMIIEAMKMENLVVSPRDAVVKSVNVSVNDRVESSTALVEFEE